MRRVHTPRPGWNDEPPEFGEAPQPAVTPQQIDERIDEVTRELGDRVGIRGSLGRVGTSGVQFAPGSGFTASDGDTPKSQIFPSGDVLFGSDISSPGGLSFGVFVNTQDWNAEEMGAGDFLIGDNSDGSANVKYNSEEGRLEFRLGQTVNIFTDTEGAFTFANNVTGLSFAATNPTQTAYLKMTSDDEFWIRNSVDGKPIRLNVDLTDANARSLTWGEDTENANVTQLNLGKGTAGGKFSLDSSVVVWAAKDGVATVFNEDNFDIDFRVESATNSNAIFLDAASEYVSLFGTGGSALVAFDNGTDKRLEIGADHYFPTRDSSNPNGFWNEANQDMDFTFEGTTDESLLKVDAGLDGIGMGGAAESEVKLKVHGNVNLSSGSEYQVNSVPLVLPSTYTPTLTNTTNISASSVPGAWSYIRFLDHVLISGPVTIDPTAAALTTINISIPIASNFTTAFQASGNATQQNTNTVGSIASDATADNISLSFTATDTASRSWRVMAIYQIV